MVARLLTYKTNFIQAFKWFKIRHEQLIVKNIEFYELIESSRRLIFSIFDIIYFEDTGKFSTVIIVTIWYQHDTDVCKVTFRLVQLCPSEGIEQVNGKIDLCSTHYVINQTIGVKFIIRTLITRQLSIIDCSTIFEFVQF